MADAACATIKIVASSWILFIPSKFMPLCAVEALNFPEVVMELRRKELGAILLRQDDADDAGQLLFLFDLGYAVDEPLSSYFFFGIC